MYTPEQLRWLTVWYPHWQRPYLTERFNARFNESKTVVQIVHALRNNRIKSYRDAKFQTAQRPWNAGTKGQGLTGKNGGTFTAGHTPATRLPLGSERIDSKDGYVLVKIAERDPHTGFPTRYKAKHVFLWEQANGPVPAGHAIIFRNGNIYDFSPDNLICVSRATLARLNQMHYHDQPDTIKPSVLTLAHLKTVIGNRSRKKTSSKQRGQSCQQ